MPEHMSQAEICTMDRMQKHGRSAAAILACLQAARTKNGTDGPSDSAVHRFLAGETYKRGSKELRGAKARLQAQNRGGGVVCPPATQQLHNNYTTTYITTYTTTYITIQFPLKKQQKQHRQTKQKYMLPLM